MMVFIVYAILFLIASLIKSKTTSGKDVFVAYAIIACVCALASTQLSEGFAMILYIVALAEFIFFTKEWENESAR